MAFLFTFLRQLFPKRPTIAVRFGQLDWRTVIEPRLEESVINPAFLKAFRVLTVAVVL